MRAPRLPFLLAIPAVLCPAVSGQTIDVTAEVRIGQGSGGFLALLADGDRLGASLAWLGDVNGDGIDDLAMGSPLDDDGGTDRGALRVMFLAADGSVASWQKISDTAGGFTGVLADGDRFGTAITSIGDLDGDGIRELAVGMPGTPFSGTGWPGGAANDISAGLPGGFEPSGVTWHAGLERLVVVSDDGRVASLSETGSVMTLANPGGDLEAVVVADPTGDRVLLGIEDPDSVVELDLSSGQLTGKAWDLTPWMTGPATQGLEALAWVNGLLYAGLQASGDIFVFELGPNGTVQHVQVLPAPGGRDDLSGLHWDAEAGILFAIYDPDDLVLELAPDGTVLRAYPLPGGSQEGVALIPRCPSPTAPFVIADDLGILARHDTYLVSCDGSRELWGRGTVWIVFLNADGTVRDFERIAHGLGGFPSILDVGDGFGLSLASLGDLNGDGREELAVGAPLDDDGAPDEFGQRGALYLLTLLSDGRVGTWRKVSATSGGFGGVLNDGDAFGWSLAAPGDVDGDGVTDLVAGAPFDDEGGTNRGVVWLLSLDASLSVTGEARIGGTDVGVADGDVFGVGLAAAPAGLLGAAPGVAVGAPGDDGAGADRGALYLLGLASDGSVLEQHEVSSTAGGLFGPLRNGDRFGSSLAPLGDLDGNGRPELAVGAPDDSLVGVRRGASWTLSLERSVLGTPFCFATAGCPCGNVGTTDTGCSNSASPGAAIVPSGSPSVSADDLEFAVIGVPSVQFGLVFMGQGTVAPTPFGDGLRCVGGSLFRFPARLSDGFGVLTEGPGIVGWTVGNLAPAGHIGVGSTWNFQCWYRDPNGPCGKTSNGSSGLSVTFVP